VKSRPTKWRFSRWEKIRVHPNADREKLTALKKDMIQVFIAGDLETYWRLDRELRWLMQQEK